MLKKLKLIMSFISTSFLMLVLSGCKMALLDPQGVIASQEKHILLQSVWLMSLVVVPVIILVFFVAWRYRESNDQATYSPEWAHSTALEIVWWTIPCIIIAILGTITWVSSHTLDPYRELHVNQAKPITIQVIAMQWKWLFIYPDEHIATVNFVQVPVGVPVRFVITAEGPMNSFQIPQLGGQIYAMAGMQTRLNLIANNPGDYKGISANFSGDGFAGMKFIARASSATAYADWVKEVKQSGNALTMMAYNDLLKPTSDDPVKYYASADNNLFSAAVMKEMMPMDANGKMIR